MVLIRKNDLGFILNPFETFLVAKGCRKTRKKIFSEKRLWYNT